MSYRGNPQIHRRGGRLSLRLLQRNEATSVNLADKLGFNQAQFWLRGVRPEELVSYQEQAGLWNVYGYPEIAEALSDPVVFSSETQRLAGEWESFTEGNIVAMDPPAHKKLRKLVSQAFTPKVVADLEPRIAAVTADLLDKVSGRMELVADLAYPLPVIVIADLLGVPSSDHPLFKQWVEAMFSTGTQISLKDPSPEQQEHFEQGMAQVENLTGYLKVHIRERRVQPRDDLLTKLVEAEVDGQRLTDVEASNFAMALLVAGHLTTTMLLGNTILCLDAFPDQRAKVQADRALVPGAIEEAMRFLSPSGAVARVTTREVKLGGRTIPANQMVIMWVAAANRDPRQFTDPDVFDLTRDPNTQMSFGRGIHFCLGAPLARLESRVALNILLDRFPDLRTDPDDPPEVMPHPTMAGAKRLPLLL
ncbi:cytochrome P450 [Micromonospora echinospora]